MLIFRLKSILSKTVFLAVLLFNSCAQPPRANVQVNEEIPSSWQIPLPSQSDLTGEWWEVFSDTLFSQHLNTFQSNSPDLLSIVTRLEIAEQTAKMNGAGVFPSINIGNSGSVRKQNLSAFGFSSNMLGFGSNDSTNEGSNSSVISFDSQNYGLNVNMQWELDIWGKLINQRRAAFKDYEASKNDLAYLQFSLSAQFTTVYYNAVESKIQYKLALETSRAIEDVRKIVKDRYANGLASSLELRLAESSLAVNTIQLENLKSQSKRSIRALELLMGKYPSGTLGVSSKFSHVLPSVPDGIQSEILERRPDVQAAINNVEASTYRLMQSKRNRLPSFALTASGGTSTSDLKELLNGDFSVWNLGANVTAPIFQGGRLKANVALNESQLTLAEKNAVKIILTALSEVEQSLADDLGIQKQYEAVRVAEGQTEAAYQLAVDRYENGVTDLITVLNSQQQWFNTRSTEVSIEKQRIINRINLLLALGGDFSVNAQ